MKRITLNTYGVRELSKEAQAKALEQYRYINVDDDFWYTPIVEAWTEKLTRYGFEEARIFFSGFYSQGDGACFMARVNLLRLMRYLKAQPAYIKRAGELLERGEIEAMIIDLGGNYSHERTKRFTFAEDEPADIVQNIERMGEELRLKLSQQIYKELRDEYESAVKDEAVIETLEANEYQFFKDGRCFVNAK